MRNLYITSLICLMSVCARAQIVPLFGIVTTSSLQCTGIPISYSAAVPPTTQSYTWSIQPVKGLVAFSDLNSPTLSVTFTTTINYTITLSVPNATGIAVTFITVSPNRKANASFNAALTNSGFPAQLMLTNYSTNSVKSKWLFNDAPVDSSDNVVKNYAASGSYSVTLLALGTLGCNDTSTYTFRISDSSSVVLPNVFSPNGDDANDLYRPITTGISLLNAWVYNRYGLLIARWDKVKGFWDGHTTTGEVCDEGQYIIILEAIGFDGKDYKLKNTITLVR